MLNRITIAIIYLLLFLQQATGQITDKSLLVDTTIYFDELVFNSDYEKNTFKEIYFNDSKDYFSLIYLAYGKANKDEVQQSRAKLYNKIASYKSKNIKAKGEKKSIKIIYKDVHNEFFTKYELINHFENVFDRGYYNCLSATFIYSLIMEELEIPYQINILPSHVNLTTYPETHQILIETTDPIKGYIKYDKKFKEDYVNNLVAYKLIEEDEAKINSIDNLFEKYYSSKEVVTIKQLVGTQYSNEGVYLLEDEKMEEAIVKLEKSIALYPSTTTAKILMLLYSKMILKADFSEEKNLDYLIKMSRYRELRSDMDEGLIIEFGNIADNYLIEKGDTSTFNLAYKKLLTCVESENSINRFEYIYLAAFGEYFFQDLKYREASVYFLDALNLVGDTNNLEDNYIRSVVLQLSGMTNMTEVIDVMDNTEKDYPNSKKNNMFMTAKSRMLTFLMTMSFEQNRVADGEKYRKELEGILSMDGIHKDEKSIGMAYSEAGSCYFRRGSRSKARVLLNKGLEYAPGDYELETRLKMLNY